MPKLAPLAAAAAIAACALALPPAAGAARGMEVAVQDDLVFLERGGARGQYFSRDNAFAKLRALNGSWLRVNLIWSHAVGTSQANMRTRPRRVVYDWAAYDSLVTLARGYGVKVQFALTGPAPAWATPKRDARKGYYRPDPRLFGQFARAAARHFRGRVSRYSIWNEPNWHTWLGPLREAPLRYRDLYRSAYAAIKRSDRRAQVLIGELAPYAQRGKSTAPLRFLRALTCVDGRYRKLRGRAGRRCRGGVLKADGFAHHPYDFLSPPERARKGADNVTLASLARLTRALDRLKRARVLVPRRGRYLPLYLTEFGYFRAGPRRLSEARRAAWTVRGFRIAQRNPRVRQMLYYIFVRPPGVTSFDLSLLNANGAETGAYRALARWSRAAARRGQIRRPGRRRAGVRDTSPPSPAPPAPPPPQPPPPAPPSGNGGGSQDPGQTPAPGQTPPPTCSVPVPAGLPCPALSL